MFNNKSRPLYPLCDLMRIERINKQTYFDILYKRAIQQWGKRIDSNAIAEVLSLTKCHTYYINALCRQVWKQNNSPSVAVIQQTWLSYIDTQSPWISDDLSHLSPNQRNILAAIAYSNISEPYSQEFSEKVRIAPSSIRKSLDILLKDDLVYRDKNNCYQVLDPAIETYLQRIMYFDFL